MEKIMKSKQAYSLFMWACMAALLLSQNLLALQAMPSPIFEDQKNFFHFPIDPHAPPTVSQPSPPHGSSSGGVSHGNPPSHGTPSHGGGGSYGGSTPLVNCGKPPSGSGHHYNPTPSSSPPKSSGGGYHSHPPPNPTPTTPSTPITTPITPSLPSPPLDPHHPFTGTCTFWKTHTGIIWSLFGWWGNLGGTFGVPGVHGFGSHMSLLDALSNTRPDALGALYREGTASYLNSLVNKRFPYTTKHVRESFVAALNSDKAASAQAQLFKLANEGTLNP